MKIWKSAIVIMALLLFGNANASVIRTINEVQYEWLELTETTGSHRQEIEVRLLDQNDVLFGYQYATRLQVEELLLTYVQYSSDGHYTSLEKISGIEGYLSDFGTTVTMVDNSVLMTVDGGNVAIDGWYGSRALYGDKSECLEISCETNIRAFTDHGSTVSVELRGYQGFNSQYLRPLTQFTSDADTRIGSHLVRLHVVPLPASFWLFVTGLIGLVTFSRHQKQ